MGDRTDMTGIDDQRSTINSQHADTHIVEMQETSPLLNSSEIRYRWFDKAMLICLVVMLIIGVIVGTYLLCVEGESEITEKVTIVPRSEWSIGPQILNISRLQLPSNRLMILQTNTNRCSNKLECSIELRNLERYDINYLNESAIRYNFMVGSDGRIYEGRGWRYQSDFQDHEENILTMAFIGTYDDIRPNNQQRKSLKAFLDYAIMKNNLVPCFNLLSGDWTPKYLVDLAYAIKQRENKEDGC